MKFQMVNRDWAKINKASPMVVRRSSGSVVELECEASGSPAPTITWLRDNIPISDVCIFLLNNNQQLKIYINQMWYYRKKSMKTTQSLNQAPTK